MPVQDFCMGHMSGFQHLKIELGGLEKRFDLGYKYEELEGDTEPYLALYVSVKHQGMTDALPPTLHYGMSRSQYSQGLTASEQDRSKLLLLALPAIKRDVSAMAAGDSPGNLEHVEMLG